MARDEVLEQHERASRAPCELHAESSARQHRGHLHDAEARLEHVVLAREHDAEVEALVAQVRERVPGIDRDRREHREDVVVEALVEAGELVGREIRRLDEHRRPRARARERARRSSSWYCGVDELVGARADGRELLVRHHAVGGDLFDLAGELLLQPGDAHHEELVEVDADDGEELEPLVAAAPPRPPPRRARAR